MCVFAPAKSALAAKQYTWLQAAEPTRNHLVVYTYGVSYLSSRESLSNAVFLYVHTHTHTYTNNSPESSKYLAITSHSLPVSLS